MFWRDKFSEDETALLHRAASWPHYASIENLTGEALQQITLQEGVDFATALLFDRFRKSPERAPFIQQIGRLLEKPAQPLPKIDAKVVIIPGALYVERPDMGGDGRLIREVAASFGLQSDLIPLVSFGSATKNAELIRVWLKQHATERIILVSLSKGGADLKLAAAASDATDLFRNVVAWISVCGPLSGSRMANWILESRVRTCFFRWKFRWQKRDFQFVTDLNHGAGSPLDFTLHVPASIKMVSMIGFPLRRHMTTPFSRFCHRIQSHAGPNDGTTLLADLRALPGEIYPVWGMDHYFRPEKTAKELVAAILRYLA